MRPWSAETGRAVRVIAGRPGWDMKCKCVLILLTAAIAVTSCSRCTLNGFSFSRTVTLMSYNVENLFDDRDDGTEYTDYDPGSSDWNTALYHAKLKSVAEAIEAGGKGGPDICLLQEVENERVVTDLLEGYLNVLKYRHAVTAPKNGSATTVALLSRFRPHTVQVHSVYVDDDVLLRPILEVHFDIHGAELLVFNNHWKSKSGGAEETERYRRAAAGFISERVAAIRRDRPDLCIIIAGDLNERPDEQAAVGCAYPTALTVAGDCVAAANHAGLADDKTLRLTGSWAAAVEDSTLFFSPWLESSYGGSYAYAGAWERIDHFLIAAVPDGNGFRYKEFEVIAADFLLDREGFPLRWNTRLASGYSDHLPIVLTIESMIRRRIPRCSG